MTSRELSEFLLFEMERGNSQFNFVIGSSYGLSKTVAEQADLQLSFSAMTFPHQLVRVMLVEQLYRAYKIASGETYHK